MAVFDMGSLTEFGGQTTVSLNDSIIVAPIKRSQAEGVLEQWQRLTISTEIKGPADDNEARQL